MNTPSVEQTIDVFVDLENLGGLPRELSLEKIFKETGWVKRIKRGLRPSLRHEGYKLGFVGIFARNMRPFAGPIPEDIQDALCKAFERHGWHMLWSNKIADDALIGWVQDRLKTGELAKTVMVMSSDGDFRSLIRQLKGTGRIVWVAGKNTSRKLIRASDRAFRL